MEQPAKGMLWMSQAVLCFAYSKRMLHIADSAHKVDEGFGQAVAALTVLEGKSDTNTLEVRLRNSKYRCNIKDFVVVNTDVCTVRIVQVSLLHFT